jgi:trehalose/maltose transport system substrate-binding protein
MYRFLFLCFSLLLAFVHTAHAGVQLTFACGSVGTERTLCEEAAVAWGKQTGNTVTVLATPANVTDRLALYQQNLSAGSADIDVYQIDLIWAGMLAGHFLDLSPWFPKTELDKHFAAAVTNNTVYGRLVAAPWYMDGAVLYYRRDLLEKYKQPVPTTYSELSSTAYTIQNAERKTGKADMWGYVFQGRAYEGLTCDALEWLEAFGGGGVVNPQGRITVNNKNAARALRQAASWIGTISPRGTLNYTEEEARGVFQSGRAVFMRNWFYAYALMQNPESSVRGKIGIVVLPSGAPGGRHAATLGGHHLAVSKYSKHPEQAVAFVRYLTSYTEQKRRAVVGDFRPTIKALYTDAELLKANPTLGLSQQVFDQAVVRPSSPTGLKYNQVSTLFWNAVHDVLSGRAEPEPVLADLERSLTRISRGGSW